MERKGRRRFIEAGELIVTESLRESWGRTEKAYNREYRAGESFEVSCFQNIKELRRFLNLLSSNTDLRSSSTLPNWSSRKTTKKE